MTNIDELERRGRATRALYGIGVARTCPTCSHRWPWEEAAWLRDRPWLAQSNFCPNCCPSTHEAHLWQQHQRRTAEHEPAICKVTRAISPSDWERIMVEASRFLLLVFSSVAPPRTRTIPVIGIPDPSQAEQMRTPWGSREGEVDDFLPRCFTLALLEIRFFARRPVVVLTNPIPWLVLWEGPPPPRSIIHSSL